MSLFENIETLETLETPEILIEADDCRVFYQASFLPQDQTQELFEYLLGNVEWQHDRAIIYGKEIITKRKIAWFAGDGLDYNYSGVSRVGKPWDPRVLAVKEQLESELGVSFNSCLLNLYHSGAEGMGWHSDDQNHLEPSSTTVAIISLGAERFFKLRQNGKLGGKNDQRKVLLEKGSLLVMQGKTQDYWQHEIPKMLAIKDIRISLTWRTMKKI
jgi:alkylated DNA repair dioxygenase AlkB